MTFLEGDTDRIALRRGTPGPVALPAAVTVIVVDPHAPVREGLPLLLAPEGIDVVAAAATGDGGETLIAQHQPDVALIALDLVDVDGVVLLERLLRRGVRSALVLYTDADDADQAAIAVHAGAAGVVAKRHAIGELAAALRTVAGGGVWFSEPSAGPSAKSLRPQLSLAIAPATPATRTAAMSDAERRVLALVAAGRSTEAAAEALSVSPHTVRTHLRNVMRKLEASSRAHAVAIAIREAAIEV